VKRWAIEGPDGGRDFFSDTRQQAIDKLVNYHLISAGPGSPPQDWQALLAKGYRVAKTGGR